MGCNFDISKCDMSCPRFSQCSYIEIERQISAMQSQISMLFQAVNKLSYIAICNEAEMKKGDNNDSKTNI